MLKIAIRDDEPIITIKKFDSKRRKFDTTFVFTQKPSILGFST